MQAQDPNPARGRGLLEAVLLFALSLVVYLANGRGQGTYDTEPATLIPHALLNGDGLVLDRYAEWMRDETNDASFYVAWKRDHLVSRYPVVPALFTVPVVAVGRSVLDRIEPRWRAETLLEWDHAHDLAKFPTAALAALAVALLPGWLRAVGVRRGVLPATLAFAVGSTQWTTCSQAPWSHTTAVLMLVVALRLVESPRHRRLRAAGSGLALGLMIGSRLTDAVFALAIVAWLARHDLRRLAWVVPPLVGVVLLVFAHNIYWFGTPLGGQAELESLHPTTHAVAGAWTTNLLDGGLGTLFSPSRGLFVFQPWTLVALVVAPWSLWAWRGGGPSRWTLVALVPYFLLLAAYTVWWGGFCFGPRYWSDAAPLLALLLALGIDWAVDRAPWFSMLVALTLVWSILIQAAGAWWYPSSWSMKPRNVDIHHERLWDWGDSELTRMLGERLMRR